MLSSLLALLLTLATLSPPTDAAGGVKGRVLSKLDRTAVQHARVTVLDGATPLVVTQTDAKGNFQALGLPDGQYVLEITAPDLLENRIKVSVSDGRVKNVFNILLQGVNRVADDAPDAAFGASDIFSSLSRYQFHQLRDYPRGQSVDSREIYVAGVRMDEVAPLELVNGLEESMRSHSAFWGPGLSETAFGGSGGAVELEATASSFRTGLSSRLLSHGALYALRGQAAYASGPLRGGWTVAGEVSAHTRSFADLPGQTLAGYLGVDKRFSSQHKLSAALFHTAAPLGFVRYDFTPSSRWSAYLTALGRFPSADAASLHLSAALSWRPMAQLSFSGGLDGRLGTHTLSGSRRLEGWLRGRGTLGRFGLQAGFRLGERTDSGIPSRYGDVKLGVDYRLGNLLFSVQSGYFSREQSPQWQRSLSSDANVSYSGNGVNLRLTGFFLTTLGTSDKLAGIEMGFKLPVLVIPNVSLQALVSAPLYGEAPFGPQLVASAGISWSANAWFAEADVLHVDKQVSVNLQAGKSWKLKGKYLLGVATGLRKIPIPGYHYLTSIFFRM